MLIEKYMFGLSKLQKIYLIVGIGNYWIEDLSTKKD